MGLSKIRLIKFRSLTSRTDYARAEEIIETGKFHCSKLWNLNDPMEGVYKTTDTSNIKEAFSVKNKYVICSFSSKETLKNHLLWGYYADGYKGIAIEIEYREKIINDINNEEVDDHCIVKVSYVDDNVEINKYDNSFKKIMFYKLKLWEHENEYRYLKRLDSGKEGTFKIGEIKKVYFGSPYSNIINKKSINDTSKKLTEYEEYEKDLREICKNKGIEPVTYTPYQ